MAGSGIGMSLLLIAVGLVLALAVDYSVQGVDIRAIGAILAGVGGLGLLVSVLFMIGVIGAETSDSGHGHHTA